MFVAKTGSIQISVEPSYVREESDPANNYYFFSYTVQIRNDGGDTVQLLSRHWIITDAFGKVEEVRGAGVVGVQPKLKPGETFKYSSFCPLPTPTGTMKGTYTMVDSQGQKTEVAIPLFILSEPSHYH